MVRLGLSQQNTPPILKIGGVVLAASCIISCQKMDRPVLGDYPKDTNPVGGPLKFYAAFDGTTEDPKMNAVDSVRATFATENTLKQIDGVSGKAVEGEADKMVKYPTVADFNSSGSISVAFWMKRNGTPENYAEFIFSLPSTVGHWSNATMFLLMDNKGAGSTNDSAVVKFFIYDTKGEKWFEFLRNNRLGGIYDGKWHHLAFVYDQATSGLTAYVDGVAKSTQSWAGHGPLTVVSDKVSGLWVGGRTTDWGQSWLGGLDQFRLYGTALTAAEVKALYDAKK